MRSILWIVLVVGLIPRISFAQQLVSDPLLQRTGYPFRSGIVEYLQKGATTGTRTIYIDRYGDRYAQFDSALKKDGDQSTKQEWRKLFVDGWIYEIDLTNKTGRKRRDPTTAEFAKLSKPERQRLAAQASRIRERMGFHRQDVQQVAGKNCDVWFLPTMNLNSCVWKGIPLKIKSAFLGKRNELTAYTIELDQKIDPKVFRVPAGIEWTEVKAVEVGGE